MPTTDSPTPDAMKPDTQVTVSALTVECEDPTELAQFWYLLLGGDVVSFPEHTVVSLRAPGITLDFVRVKDAKQSKNRWHLDLASANPARTIDDAVAAGASRADDVFVCDRFTVMRDPEGNEFCILHDAPLGPWAPST